MFGRLLILCALVASVACGGAKSVDLPDASLSGIWTLRSVNNAALPYTLSQSPTYPTTILGATLTISGTGAGFYGEVISTRVVTPMRTMDTSLTYAGTWVLKGATITFNEQTSPDAYQGSVVNDAIVKVVLFGYSGEYSR